MTLNKTWRLCMSMWRWIANEWRKGIRTDIVTLKEKWLKIHGFEDDEIESDCFFCDYQDTHKKQVSVPEDICSGCPGVFVDRTFVCNDNYSDYHYYNNPIAFYNKLRSLNRKRLAKK